MPFSHHSHSGEFCGHATNTLEEVVQAAVAKGMTSFCMTEHIQRERVDFYPGEEQYHTPESLETLYDKFYHEAKRLQAAYSDRIQLFVGFESEWIRRSSLDIIQKILGKYEVDLFVGSVHHVYTIPIDFDTPLYHKARAIADGSDEKIAERYFDDQLAMLEALKPPVVGHLDLIRLKSDDPERSFLQWPAVWEKILRNLKFVAGYGGVLELNSSSLRKGMSEAYPQVEICRVSQPKTSCGLMANWFQEFVELGGRFTLSDDSHGVAQVGLNYDKVLGCIKKAGIKELHFLAPISDSVRAHDTRFPKVGWRSIAVADLEKLDFWKR
jgi:histidinol-phosphatase (PHP family)